MTTSLFQFYFNFISNGDYRARSFIQERKRDREMDSLFIFIYLWLASDDDKYEHAVQCIYQIGNDPKCMPIAVVQRRMNPR